MPHMAKQSDANAAIKKIEKNLANYGTADVSKIRKMLMGIVTGKTKDTIHVRATKDKKAYSYEVEPSVGDKINAAKVYGTVLLPKTVADKKQTDKTESPLDHEGATAKVHEKIQAKANEKKKIAACGAGSGQKVVEFPKAAKATGSLFGKKGK